MNRSHRVIFILLAGMCALSSGCATLQSGGALNQYKELEGISFGHEEHSKMADTAPALTEKSTLSDYLAYAALHNPELEAAFNRWKAALEKIPQVQSLPDPRFNYLYYIENVETRVGPQQHAFNLSQTFPWFGKLELNGDVALEEANIQKQNYETLKLRLFFRVKKVYYEYYYLIRNIEITKDNMGLLTSLENVARIQYTSGKSSYANVIKTQVEIGILEERLLSLDDLRVPIAADLNAALNRPANAPLPSKLAIPGEELVLPDASVYERLKQTNPDLKALDFQIKKRAKSVELAKKQFYPDLTVGLNYIQTGTSQMQGTPDSGKDSVIGMFSINLPIWRKKYHAAVREAQTLEKSSAETLSDRENNLIAELERSLYNFRDSERKIELFKNTLIPKAKQSLNVSLRAFEAGKADFLNLVDAQRTLLGLELSYERALSNRASHYAHIEMLVGDDYVERNE